MSVRIQADRKVTNMIRVMFGRLTGIVRSFTVRQLERDVCVLQHFINGQDAQQDGITFKSTANAVGLGCRLSLLTIDARLGRLVAEELLYRSEERLSWANPEKFDWFYTIANRAMVEARVKEIRAILGQEVRTHESLAEIPFTEEECA